MTSRAWSGLAVTLSVAAAAQLVACSPSRAAAPEPARLNLVVLLDLSDRIDPSRPETRDQAAMDRQIVRRVVEVFSDEVKRKRFVLSRDRLQIVVAPQPTDYRGLVQESAAKLRIDVGALPLRDRRQLLPKLQRELIARVDGLYEKATSARRFIGADIWSFFRNNLEDYLPCPGPGERVRNVLVLVTDGYLDFDEAVQRTRPREGQRTSFMQVGRYRGAGIEALRTPDHGLIAIRNDAFRCGEVLVLEMTERQVGDRAVLQEYWGKWLTEMGVGRYELKMGADSAAQTGEVVERFLRGVAVAQAN